MTTIPTLSQLYASIVADLEAKLNLSIPAFGKAFIPALAAVQAAKLWLQWKALGILQTNILPDTAQSELLGGTLERFGRIKLNRDPSQATAGVYTLTVHGAIGAVIKAQTTFKSNDGSNSPGYLFIIDNDYTLVSNYDTITVRALTAGKESELISSDGLNATQPIALVDSAAFVQTVVTAPLDAEGIEDYRTKILKSYLLEPQGGAAADYILWGLDAVGVKAIYPYIALAPNEVDIYVEAEKANSYDGDGTPTVTMLANVYAAIQQDPDTSLTDYERGRRPLGVFRTNVYPITPHSVNVTIAGSNLTAATKALITEAIQEFIDTVRPFIDSADDVNKRNDILNINLLVYALLNANPGTIFTSLSMTVDGVNQVSVQFTFGDIPYLNNVIFS